ncbi:hypothetical protein D0Z66_12080 [Cereibacter sphaeroides]|nr:hypothetical protein D0Z66_12080 [Cereibacter sphaeroides]MBO4170686.1 hypothetical protein [Cereibacter azotoformans]
MIRPMMRPVLAFLLSLVLAAASLTVSAAHGQAAARQVVICTGHGVATIALDREGRPVGPLHPCPDCLAGLGTAVAPPFCPMPRAPLSRGEGLPRSAPVVAAGRPSPAPCARDPPAPSV